LSFRDPSEEKIVENFLDEEGVQEDNKFKILKIIKGMGEFEENLNLLAPQHCFHLLFFFN